MSDKPAVIEGCYVDAKFMRGLKVMRLSVDIPIEYSNEFIRMFGAPDGVNPVAVAIARLNAAAVPERAEPAAPVVKAETDRGAFRDKARSSQCYLMLQKVDFIRWFAGNYLKGVPVNRTEGYEPHVKRYLGIESKADLDVDGPKAEAWDQLLTDFEMRDLAR